MTDLRTDFVDNARERVALGGIWLLIYILLADCTPGLHYTSHN